MSLYVSMRFIGSLLGMRSCESRLKCVFISFFFQAEDGIRDLVRSRGLGDVYKRQPVTLLEMSTTPGEPLAIPRRGPDIYQGVYRAMVILSLIHI